MPQCHNTTTPQRHNVTQGVKDLVSTARRWEELCASRDLFEAESSNQQRLFQGTGKEKKRDVGRLLREEKKRRTFERDLPNLEKKLKSMIVSYNAAHKNV